MRTDSNREAFEEIVRSLSDDDKKALLQHVTTPRSSNLLSSPDLGWYIIRVELLSGCGEHFDPPPGRDILISPQHTFRQLAEVINASFARWDLGHLYQFHMPDGSRIGTVFEDDDEMHEAARRKLGRRAEGDVFIFEFDFGDSWMHRCTIIEEVEPEDAYGVRPKGPVPVWGWGQIPDQYGRITPDG
jgi:hypothetical protein